MTQRDQVLTLLTEAGLAGVTNAEFARRRILRFGARIEELRKSGAEITCERVSGGTYRYILEERVEGGESPGLSSLTEEAPALHTDLCVVRELDGTWHEAPTPQWALAGEGR